MYIEEIIKKNRKRISPNHEIECLLLRAYTCVYIIFIYHVCLYVQINLYVHTYILSIIR